MKLTKSILLSISIIFLLLYINEAIGQETKVDVLYLQNESIIKGSIIELEPSVLVKI